MVFSNITLVCVLLGHSLMFSSIITVLNHLCSSTIPPNVPTIHKKCQKYDDDDDKHCKPVHMLIMYYTFITYCLNVKYVLCMCLLPLCSFKISYYRSFEKSSSRLCCMFLQTLCDPFIITQLSELGDYLMDFTSRTLTALVPNASLPHNIVYTITILMAN